MQRLLLIILIISSLFIYACSQVNQKSVPERVKERLTTQLDSLEIIVQNNLLRQVQKGTIDSMRVAFQNSRRAYKKVEWFTEYYAPTASKELNGAPLPEIEIEETKTFPPSGFQVIEEYIYPEFNSATRPELEREVKTFLSSLQRIRTTLETTEFTEAHILDACKQAIFRTLISGISGFDTPLAQTGVQEAAAVLQSVQEVLAYFGENEQLNQLFTQGIQFIQQNQDFNNFDRMAFITRFANPLTAGMLEWQKKLKIEPLKPDLALKVNAKTLFDKEAFNLNFFAGNLEGYSSPAKIALGKQLFFSPVVSGGTRTCGSCHKPELAFTDGLPKSEALEAGKFVQRNAPTLLYAGLQNAQFHDMRAPTLEDQAMNVIANKDEMHGSVEEAAARLNKNPTYQSAFKQAFPTIEKEILPRHIMIALASYIRSLAPFNSRFDNYIRGDKTQLTQEEVTGFNLFMGKGKCGTCHFMPVFNGTAGPAFTTTEAEVLGVPTNPRAGKLTIDPDEGRYKHNKIPELQFAFKTPTLRNVAKTAPYMHNGAFKTLQEVMDFYNEGGGAGLGLKVDTQTLPADKLNLTKAEIKAIIAFLESLSDKDQE